LDHSFLHPQYLYYALQSKHFVNQISSRKGETDMADYLSLTAQRSLSLLIPDISTQKKIVAQLSVIDAKLQLGAQTNQTLEAIAQTIFKSWFVDFDSVKAKMNGEQPEGMDAATASLFPEKLVESELGLIPEGWEVTKLSKVIDLLNGFAFKSPDYVKEGTFVLRTKNFDSSNSVERLGDDVYLPDEFLESHKKYLCEAYDYHVVMVAASIGKTAMIYPHQLPALRNQNMWCFRPKDESLRFYTKYMVDGLVKLNMGLASGSARAFFKKGDFNSYEFALPSSELLVKFNDVVGNLVKQKGSLLNQNVQLAAMRDTLLPKLLSGEIELGQTEQEAK
jgi:type I restriction enzyme S subunit